MNIIRNRRGFTGLEILFYLSGFIIIILLSHFILNNAMSSMNSKSINNQFNNEKLVLFNLVESALKEPNRTESIITTVPNPSKHENNKTNNHVVKFESTMGNKKKIRTITEGMPTIYTEQVFETNASGTIIDPTKPLEDIELEFSTITSFEVSKPNEVCKENSTGSSLECVKASNLLEFILYHDGNKFNKKTLVKAWRVFYEG